MTESQYEPTVCSPASCANGKCQATGECIGKQWPSNDREWARNHMESPPPPTPSNTGHGHVRPRPDGIKARCGGPALCSACARDQAALMPVVKSPPLAPAAPRTIIAFTGLAGSGKSTAAQHLVARRGFHRVRFAGPLKDMMAALGLTQDEIEGSRKELPCALLGGKTPRDAMQTIGTEWGRNIIDSDLWIRAWQTALDRLPADAAVVVDDCRFPNEAAAVLAAGGVIVRIERPGAGAGAAGHSSESHVLPSSRTLHNTRDTRNLREQVDMLVGDLSWADRNAVA